jgi:hypothetical protein
LITYCADGNKNLGSIEITSYKLLASNVASNSKYKIFQNYVFMLVEAGAKNI